jgi:hypothetical protein
MTEELSQPVQCSFCGSAYEHLLPPSEASISSTSSWYRLQICDIRRPLRLRLPSPNSLNQLGGKWTTFATYPGWGSAMPTGEMVGGDVKTPLSAYQPMPERLDPSYLNVLHLRNAIQLKIHGRTAMCNAIRTPSGAAAILMHHGASASPLLMGLTRNEESTLDVAIASYRPLQTLIKSDAHLDWPNSYPLSDLITRHLSHLNDPTDLENLIVTLPLLISLGYDHELYRPLYAPPYYDSIIRVTHPHEASHCGWQIGDVLHCMDVEPQGRVSLALDDRGHINDIKTTFTKVMVDNWIPCIVIDRAISYNNKGICLRLHFVGYRISYDEWVMATSKRLRSPTPISPIHAKIVKSFQRTGLQSLQFSLPPASQSRVLSGLRLSLYQLQCYRGWVTDAIMMTLPIFPTVIASLIADFLHSPLL